MTKGVEQPREGVQVRGDKLTKRWYWVGENVTRPKRKVVAYDTTVNEE